jgi:hypothetical protein
MRRSHVVIGILLATIASLVGTLILRLCRPGDPQAIDPSLGAMEDQDEPRSTEGSADRIFIPPRLDMATMALENEPSTAGEPTPNLGDPHTDPARAADLGEFSRKYVRELELSGPAPDWVSQTGARVVESWQENGIPALRALAHFDKPECYAGGCVITATVDQLERRSDILAEFVNATGIAVMNGTKRIWNPTNADDEATDRMAFIIYSDDYNPPSIL